MKAYFYSLLVIILLFVFVKYVPDDDYVQHKTELTVVKILEAYDGNQIQYFGIFKKQDGTYFSHVINSETYSTVVIGNTYTYNLSAVDMKEKSDYKSYISLTLISLMIIYACIFIGFIIDAICF